jgi:DNA-binding IclR family transcriptional regulator
MAQQRQTGPRPRSVTSVSRALALLEELRDSEQGLGVNELARRIGVNPSTASRLLATLESAGFVQRDGHGPYRLGVSLLTLADRVLSRLDLGALARPVLVALMERTGETATLSLPGEREAITVDSVPSRSSVVSMARLGRPSVAHATAVGKVMLAFGGGPLPRERDLTALTERTITDRAALAREIERVQENGYGTVFGEREVDVNAIAAPVWGRSGALAAILGIQAPASRLEDPTRLLGPLLQGAQTLSRALGAGPALAPAHATQAAAAAAMARSSISHNAGRVVPREPAAVRPPTPREERI